jgi:cytidyltransferase-like protein
MVHGRFQPFHLGHLEYLRGAAGRCDEVFVGITNPDPTRIVPEPSDPLRHLPESNPWTYAERLLMVKAAADDLSLDPARLHVIPFPVNEPELWPAYVPEGVTQYNRLFSEGGGTKLDRFRDAVWALTGLVRVYLGHGGEPDGDPLALHPGATVADGGALHAVALGCGLVEGQNGDVAGQQVQRPFVLCAGGAEHFEPHAQLGK